MKTLDFSTALSPLDACNLFASSNRAAIIEYVCSTANSKLAYALLHRFENERGVAAEEVDRLRHLAYQTVDAGVAFLILSDNPAITADVRDHLFKVFIRAPSSRNAYELLSDSNQLNREQIMALIRCLTARDALHLLQVGDYSNTAEIRGAVIQRVIHSNEEHIIRSAINTVGYLSAIDMDILLQARSYRVSSKDLLCNEKFEGQIADMPVPLVQASAT